MFVFRLWFALMVLTFRLSWAFLSLLWYGGVSFLRWTRSRDARSLARPSEAE